MSPRRLLLLFALLGSSSACGYRFANASSDDPLGPFSIEGTRPRVPEAELIAALESGARAELSRAGMLAPPSRARAALRVELLRVDESSEGIALDPDPQTPLARALRITVTARASLFEPGHDAPLRQSGELTVSETVARQPSPEAAILARREAARRAASRLGEHLARRLLGYPEPIEP